MKILSAIIQIEYRTGKEIKGLIVWQRKIPVAPEIWNVVDLLETEMITKDAIGDLVLFLIKTKINVALRRKNR